jgi:catechol 2,3-dioxygenase-like lactoylglutathione lyase family enzyme
MVREQPGAALLHTCLVRTNLLVIYTTRVEECRDFYTSLGMNLQSEQHGTGPRHYAAELADGTVFEIYPAAQGQETGRLRLGFTLTGVPDRRVLRDPDGRAVEVHGP